MKASSVVGMILFGVLAIVGMSTIGCDYVEPGYVAIKVNLYGDEKGVDDIPLETGRIWYNKWTQRVYDYPTFMQTRAWTDDVNEGSPLQEGITFNSSEGAVVTADVALNYSVEPSLVPVMFKKFRQTIEVITSTYLRNQVRDAFNRVAGEYKAIDIFGEGKNAMLDAVQKELVDKLGPFGFNIDSVSFIGSPRAEPRVMQSISSVIEATQRAAEAENKVRQIEAEAKQEIARADGEAQSIQRVAEARAAANEVINASLTPELIEYKRIEQWDGKLPTFVGGASGGGLGVLINGMPSATP